MPAIRFSQAPEADAYYAEGPSGLVVFRPEGVEFGPSLTLDFVGAWPDVSIHGDAHHVSYQGVWPGIDVEYRQDDGRLKSTYVIAPGANPRAIRLAYHGATSATVTEPGQLVVTAPQGTVEEAAPYAYQDVDGQLRQVEARFEVAGAIVRFTLGEYDVSLPLVLDPVVLRYCGFIGGYSNGFSTLGDIGYAIAIDSTGNVYVAGYTASSEVAATPFPVTVGPDTTYGGGFDVFVAKVNSAGTGLLYCGYIGGSSSDYGYSIAIDSTGNAYITGETASSQAAATPFPVTVGPDTIHGTGEDVESGIPTSDAFVAKLGINEESGIFVGNSSSGSASATSLTFTHVGDGLSNSLLLVGVSIATVTSTVTGITYGGTPLTQVTNGQGNSAGSARVEMWYLKMPAAGAADVVVTLGATSAMAAGALNLSQVNQTTPFETFVSAKGSDFTPIVSGITSSAPDIVVDVMASVSNPAVTQASAQTLAWTKAYSTTVTGAQSWQPSASLSSYTLSTTQTWVIGAVSIKPSSASALRLESFESYRHGSGVALQWNTGMEVDNLGFNLYREVGGTRTRLNPSLIAGSALLTGQGATLVAGNVYSWLDESSPSASPAYWLEEVDLAGKSLWHGPATPAAGSFWPSRSGLLSNLGASTPRNAAPHRAARSRKALNGEVWAKLYVREEGWHRVSFAELAEVGFVVPSSSALSLLVDGREQPLLVTGEGVEFYGVPIDSPYTDERAYWLASSGKALRVAQAGRAGPTASKSQSFPHAVTRSEKSVYVAALKNGDAENFFGPVVSSSPAEQVLLVEALATPQAEFEVSLQGVTLSVHQVEVLLNGSLAGVASFSGQGRGSFKVPVLAVEGSNTIALVARGDDKDVSMVDFVRLTYARKYEAVGNLLRATVPAGQAATITGFTRPDIRVMDITLPTAPIELTGAAVADASGYAVEVGAAPNARSLLVFSPEAVKRPDYLEARLAPGLRPTGADFVILSHPHFLDSMQPLADRRRAEGLSVDVVDVEDVYDSHGDGNKSPWAIKNFLSGAYQRGTRYVLLVGDASFDPKSYLGLGNFDYLPTGTVESQYLETSSDDGLADFNGDGVPELMLGRLPVRTAAEADTVVGKLLRYRPQLPSLVALTGPKSDSNFAQTNEALIDSLPEGVSIKELNTDDMGAERARLQFLYTLEEGRAVAEYLGHGSTQLWANNFLSSREAPLMKMTGPLPLFLSLTCLNGYFHDAAAESLGEALLKAPHGGAIAVYASSASSTPSEQVRTARAFLGKLLADESTLGAASLAAKVAHRDANSQGWILFGDPTLKLVAGDGVGPKRRGCGCDASAGPALLLALLALAVRVHTRRQRR